MRCGVVFGQLLMQESENPVEGCPCGFPLGIDQVGCENAMGRLISLRISGLGGNFNALESFAQIPAQALEALGRAEGIALKSKAEDAQSLGCGTILKSRQTFLGKVKATAASLTDGKR